MKPFQTVRLTSGKQAKSFLDGNDSVCLCMHVMRGDKPALLMRNELINQFAMQGKDSGEIVITQELALQLIDELASLFPFAPVTKRFNLLRKETEE